jgi:hypothetical protein
MGRQSCAKISQSLPQVDLKKGPGHLIPSPPQIAWRAKLFNSPFSYLNWYASGVKTITGKSLDSTGSKFRAPTVILQYFPVKL